MHIGLLLKSILFHTVLNYGEMVLMVLHGKDIWCTMPPGKRIWYWQQNCLHLRQISKILKSWWLSTDCSTSSWGISPSVLKSGLDSVPHGPLYLLRVKILSVEENVLTPYYLGTHHKQMFSLITFLWEYQNIKVWSWKHPHFEEHISCLF